MGIWISPIQWKWIYINFRVDERIYTHISLTRVRSQDNSVSPISSRLFKVASLPSFLFIRGEREGGNTDTRTRWKGFLFESQCRGNNWSIVADCSVWFGRRGSDGRRHGEGIARGHGAD